MPREIICPSCQQALRVRDGYTGTSMMCPRCSSKVPVPAEGDEPAEAIQDARPARAAKAARTEVQEGRPRKGGRKTERCPFCGEDIPRHAERCPHCKEWLDEDEGGPQMSVFKPCPRCGAKESRRVVWTFWGSFYGPNLFTHVRCPRCGYAYNGKTGRSNMIPAILFVTIPLLGILGIICGLGLYIFTLYGGR